MPSVKGSNFLRFFLILLIAEFVTVLAAWFLLNYGLKLWIRQKAHEMVKISNAVQTEVDWSRLDEIREGQSHSPVFLGYMRKINALNKKYFPRNDGDISAITILKGTEYSIVSEDSKPYDEVTKANNLELEAMKGRPTFSPMPYADEIGTHLSAFAPVIKNGKVIALITADFDSASLQNFQDIVKTSFWWAIGPAILISLILASLLAARFVEPMELIREIQAVKAHPEQVATSLPQTTTESPLSKRENEIAVLVGQGLKNREIADKLSISEETVKQHLKNIFQKLGITSRVNLALYALTMPQLNAEAHPPKG